MTDSFDIAVVGAGPVGSAAALALAAEGFSVALVAPDAPPDRRTSALLGQSVDFLAALGVWSAVAPASAPLRVMRIADGTRRLIRAPEVAFDAAEIGRGEFGFNVPNEALNAALADAIAATGIARVDAMVEGADPDDDGVTLALAGGGAVRARLVVAADGRRSLLRAAAGIGVREWRYDQAALVCNLRHEAPHDDTSTEFHTENGPLTLVPLPGDRSSLVWIDRPAATARRVALAPDVLAREIEARSFHLLGRIDIDGAVKSFPLAGLSVDSYAARRIALAGEAAHVFPPIGAQGLNLGYRDVADLRELAARHRDDPGGEDFLAAYRLRRGGDARTRTLAVDTLNRTLLADFLPVQALRGVGLFALDRIPSLRRMAMAAGLGVSAGDGRLRDTG